MDRYWVGGSGNWSDNAHWAASSGGVGGQSYPNSDTTNAFFDANSFSAVGQVVTFDTGVCLNLRWENIDFNPTFNLTNNIPIYGDCEFLSSVTITESSSFRFILFGTAPYVINFSNNIVLPALELRGTVDLESNLKCFYIYSGAPVTFNTNNYTIEADEIYFSDSSSLTLGDSKLIINKMDLSKSTFGLTLEVDTISWGSGFEITIKGTPPNNNTVESPIIDTHGLTVPKINIIGNSSQSNPIILYVWDYDLGVQGTITELNVTGNNFVAFYDNQTITRINCIGSSTNPIKLVGYSGSFGNPAISISSDKPYFLYTSPWGITAVGNTPFVAIGGTDIENNTGWVFHTPFGIKVSEYNYDVKTAGQDNIVFDTETLRVDNTFISSDSKTITVKDGVVMRIISPSSSISASQSRSPSTSTSLSESRSISSSNSPSPS